jgi:hypothetical protein
MALSEKWTNRPGILQVPPPRNFTTILTLGRLFNVTACDTE